MLRKTKAGFYVLERFSQINCLVHAFSTVSFGNMSIIYDKKAKVLANRARFALAVGVNPKRIISVRQKHGTKILVINSDNKDSLINQTEEITADCLLTREKNLCLFIKTADCLSILLFDPLNTVIGLLHAGRAGIKSKIHLKAIEKMRECFGSQPKKILVGIGPGICFSCYHAKIDLVSLVLKDLEKAGVKKENIETANVCTFENKDFYSHQRSLFLKEPEGRLATIYAIKES